MLRLTVLRDEGAVRIAGFSGFSEVGRGGFGVVYRAVQDSLQRPVAVKVLPDLVAGSTAYERFLREARAIGAMSGHPNIATVHACGVTEQGQGYLAMELLEGGAWAARVTTGQPDWRDAARTGVAVAGALESAHRAGVLHRDVKPQNVLFDRLGTPKLVDFGVAAYPGGYETRSASVTVTLAHAAPEVVAGGKSSPASDTYSLASSVYAAMSGHPPFAVEGEESFVPLLARIASAAPPDLRSRGVPDDVAAVLERALAKDPAQRPASTGEFGEALAAALGTHGVPAPAMSVLEPAVVAAAAAASDADVFDLETRSRPAGPVPVADTEVRRGRGRRTAVLAGAAVALLTVGGVAIAASGVLSKDPGRTVDLAGATSSPTAATSAARTATPTPKAGTTTTPVATAAPVGGGAPAVYPPGYVPPAAAPLPQVPGAPQPVPAATALPAAPTKKPAATKPGVPGSGSAGWLRTTSYAKGEAQSVEVALSWGAPSSGGSPTSYDVRRSRVGASPGVLATSRVTGRSVTLAIPADQVGFSRYKWEVRAVNAAGASSWREMSARLTNMVGRLGTDASQMARTSGALPHYEAGEAGDRAAPAGQSWTVYYQSPQSGTVSPGTSVTIRYYGD
jgi:Protein kinase domain